MTKNIDSQKGKEVVILSPGSRILEINGKLFYNEGSQAWTILRLKKDLLFKFPQLKDKRSSFGYKMIMHDTLESLKTMIKDLEKNGGNIPLLLFFCKEESN